MGDKEYSFDNITDGRVDVSVAGTAEALASSATACRKVIIKAFAENTTNVVIGASTVVASLGTRRGITLVPNEAMVLNVKDLADIYVDAETSGEGVGYVYFK